MSEKTYNQMAAERVADRIPDGFGVDPMTVLVLLQTVIPAFLDCLNRNDEEGFKALKALQGYTSAIGV